MTNLTTEAVGDSAVDQAMAQAGLQPDPNVNDVGAVAGPLLTANLVDGAGATVAAVAVLDGPAGGDDGSAEALLEALMTAAAAMAPGTTAQAGQPVAGGADLAAAFTMPTALTAYTDGTVVRAVHLTTDDRRADGVAGVAAPAGVGGVLGAPPPSGGGLDKLINVSLTVSVELGRTNVTLSDVLDYDVGSVIELDRAAGAPVDVRVNDTLLAQGEVVLIDDEYAVRITAIFDPHG